MCVCVSVCLSVCVFVQRGARRYQGIAYHADTECQRGGQGARGEVTLWPLLVFTANEAIL